MKPIEWRLNEQIESEIVRSQYETIKYGPLTNFIAGVILFVWFYNKADIAKLVCWLITLGLIDLLYGVVYFFYKLNNSLTQVMKKWRIAYLSLIGGTTALWGAAIYILTPTYSIVDQFFIIGLLLAVSSGFAQGTMTDIWACRISICFVLIPLIFWSVKQNTNFFNALNILLLIYILFLFFITTRSNKLFKANIQLHAENIIIIEKLANINSFLERKVIKQTQQLKMAKDEAETANNEKTKFLFIASQVLKIPLKTIESHQEKIKITLYKILNNFKVSRKNCFSMPYIIPQQLSRLPLLINGLANETRASLNFINMLANADSRSDSTVDNDLSKCSIINCFEESLKRYPFKQGERGLIQWHKENDFHFSGNQTLTVHIIFNLLKNSLQYIQEQGKGYVEIWVEVAENMNLLHFKDTAKGIPPDILPHIFDRYYSKSDGGTGLGLAFCQMIMKSFGGKITCNSKLNEYTEFILEFPKLS